MTYNKHKKADKEYELKFEDLESAPKPTVTKKRSHRWPKI